MKPPQDQNDCYGPTASAEPGMVDARNEALRKIGRNVVLFQQLEGVLKSLAAAQHPSMPISRAKTAHAKRLASIRVQSLGQIAGEVVEALFTGSDAESSAPDEITEPWLTVSFRIATTQASIEEDRKTLKSLIDERNDLVHHLLSRWNLQDADSCRTLSAELDEQRLRIIGEVDRYRAYATTIKEMAREFQAFIESDEGKRQFDRAFLQQSRLVTMLTTVASEHARPDGWTLLSIAGNHLRRLIPE